MAFVVPTSYRIIGPADDPTGSQQYAPRHSIGGALALDETDEATSSLENASWCYVVHAREILAQLCPEGTTTYPSAIMTTTSAAYVNACVLTFDLSEGRVGIDVLVDFGHSAGGAGTVAGVRVQVRRRDTAAVIGSGATTTAAVRTGDTVSIAIAGLTIRECYAEVDILTTTTDPGDITTLYGVQIYSDEATP